jgi:hypothetical protein
MFSSWIHRTVDNRFVVSERVTSVTDWHTQALQSQAQVNHLFSAGVQDATNLDPQVAVSTAAACFLECQLIGV